MNSDGRVNTSTLDVKVESDPRRGPAHSMSDPSVGVNGPHVLEMVAGAISAVRARATRHPNLVAFFLFVIMLGGIYWSVVVGDRSLLTNGAFPPGPLFVGDPVAGGPITLPLERLASLSWMHFTLPIVDPYQGYGVPLLAGQGVPVYLPQLLVHWLFPNNYSLWNLLNLLVLAFGSYLLARSFGQRFFAAMAVGTAAALSGVAPPNLNMAMLNPLALLPLVLVAVRYAVDPDSRHRLVACLGIVTGVSLMSMSGFQEVLPLLAVVILVYGAAMVIHFRTLRVRPILLVPAVASGAIGVFVGSVGLIPSLSVVESQSTINGPGAFGLHAPLYWLSTLSVPSLTGRAIAGSPQDLGITEWTLGSPLLVLVVVLSIFLVVRKEGRQLRWYVAPSLVLVIYGVLGYANVLHVLQIFDIPLMTATLMVRFLQFAWWVPWCLLLGAIITHVQAVRWRDAVVAVLVAGLFDLCFVIKFRDELVAQHLASYLEHTWQATVLAVVIMCAFVGVALTARWIGSRAAAAIMAAIVLGSSIYYLPRNFFSESGSRAVRSQAVPGVNVARSDYLAYLQLGQLPTTYYSMQIFGPIIPRSYQEVIGQLFSPAESGGVSALFDAAPTLGLATLNSRFVGVMRSLGTDTILSTTALTPSTLGPIPPCTSGSSGIAGEELCFLGRSPSLGGPSQPPAFAYKIVDSSPLVDPALRVVGVSSTNAGLNDVLHGLTPESTALTATAYVTTSDPHLSAARGVVGLSRTANTQSVSLVLHSRDAGLAILREAYETGMHANVNGQSVVALPVDGGLWTAVKVDSGRSRVTLDYLSTADVLAFVVAGLGTLALLVAWLAVAVVSYRKRRRTPSRGRHARGMSRGPSGTAPSRSQTASGSRPPGQVDQTAQPVV